MRTVVRLFSAAIAGILIATFMQGCVVPNRHGGLTVIAPVPGRGVTATRIPGPPVPKVHLPHVRPAPVPVPVPVLRVSPPPRPAVVVHRPAPVASNRVWVEAHWAIENGKYVWKAGYWVQAPRHGAVWVAPRTVQVGIEWQYYPGYWR